MLKATEWKNLGSSKKAETHHCVKGSYRKLSVDFSSQITEVKGSGISDSRCWNKTTNQIFCMYQNQPSKNEGVTKIPWDKQNLR